MIENFYTEWLVLLSIIAYITKIDSDSGAWERLVWSVKVAVAPPHNTTTEPHICHRALPVLLNSFWHRVPPSCRTLPIFELLLVSCTIVLLANRTFPQALPCYRVPPVLPNSSSDQSVPATSLDRILAFNSCAPRPSYLPYRLHLLSKLYPLIEVLSPRPGASSWFLIVLLKTN